MKSLEQVQAIRDLISPTSKWALRQKIDKVAYELTEEAGAVVGSFENRDYRLAADFMRTLYDTCQEYIEVLELELDWDMLKEPEDLQPEGE